MPLVTRGKEETWQQEYSRGDMRASCYGGEIAEVPEEVLAEFEQAEETLHKARIKIATFFGEK